MNDKEILGDEKPDIAPTAFEILNDDPSAFEMTYEMPSGHEEADYASDLD